MHSMRVQRLHDAARQENTHDRRRFDDLDADQYGVAEQYDVEANAADEVISEIALVLVIMFGAVLAVNLALVALHIG